VDVEGTAEGGDPVAEGGDPVAEAGQSGALAGIGASDAVTSNRC
jgi:hypothetical protein